VDAAARNGAHTPTGSTATPSAVAAAGDGTAALAATAPHAAPAGDASRRAGGTARTPGATANDETHAAAAAGARAAMTPRAAKADAAPGSAPAAAAARAAAVTGAVEAAGAVETTPAGAPPPVEPGLAPGAGARPAVAAIGLARGEATSAPFDEAVVDEVPARLVRTAEAGGRQLQVRLQPAELGRLDIRLDFDADKGVRIHIRADNDQALELLQRHGHQLERALQQSGFDVGRDAIRYDLDQGGGRFARGGGTGGGTGGDSGADAGGQGDGSEASAPAGDDAAAIDRAETPSPGVAIRNVLDLHA
jgi:flagellar hook-length control protein FliK